MTRTIVERLRDIEADVLLRFEGKDLHLGSARFMSRGKRLRVALRIPNFGMGIGKNIGGWNCVYGGVCHCSGIE